MGHHFLLSGGAGSGKTFLLVEVRISNGEISHDEVLLLAHRMFKKYPRLCDLLLDKFQFIFVDEYQDTSPLVIEILLNFLQTRKKKNIIGFFGDSMQSIYETGVGDIDNCIDLDAE